MNFRSAISCVFHVLQVDRLELFYLGGEILMFLVATYIHLPSLGHNMEYFVLRLSFNSILPVHSVCKLNEVKEDWNRFDHFIFQNCINKTLIKSLPFWDFAILSLQTLDREWRHHYIGKCNYHELS